MSEHTAENGALCERRQQTGCSGFTPPGYETYVCHKPCRVSLTGEPLYPELRDAFYAATAPRVTSPGEVTR